ncbi:MULTISPECIES: alpha/beta hydrolase [Myroides]|uniref:AB hydrolase-1 domain-containing protein n=2 Tax=Myroides odoratimimus TaxID=76832 RepID=A0AAI8C4L5_9FLAO|nr:MULTISPECIES: alpha/beta hydrolase [Myroides]ALU26553.1 hypothetical protein AS202_10510 [Myroides odoratimimus]APA92613.1 alpha/beta hydrolase [Myroides sp. ZB35]EHO13602.1 hypothetical protein HMPREF9715_01140 [Myroides odoratimimus CIP 101113]EKB03323.1 hypothetical protein HMPREF9711_02650 [Myroides odoratimimus CCUG 3837]EPH11306.1 hypothetical protein HMPREF9713_01792 [Myroides odoratimimus CCUG 12700]
MVKCLGLLINLLSLFAPKRACAIAYKLFSTPRKGQLKRRDIPYFLSEAHQDRFVYDGLSIQCYRWNQERSELPLMMLFHGWESNAGRWEELVTYLDDQYQYISIDAMGLGLSDGSNLSVIDYSHLMDHCLRAFRPQYVVAHSLGAFALLHQMSVVKYDFVEKVVLMACLDRFQHVIDNYIGMLGYWKKVSSDLLRFLEGLIDMDMGEYASRNFIKSLSNQTLIIHDKEDVVVELAECTVFHDFANQKGIEVYYTEGLGHSVQDRIVFEKIKNYFMN